MIELRAKRKPYSKEQVALKIQVGVDGSSDEVMEELEHLLGAFFRSIYEESGKCALSKAIMAARDAIQDITDEVFGGEHGKL